MPASRKRWLEYERAAADILHRLREQFGFSAVERKQSVPGLVSGTNWVLDAKGVTEESDAFVIIECRRYTTSKLKQEDLGALAFRIQDTGAERGIVISPLGLQEGAQRVAASANILSVELNADATPQEFALSFLGNLFVGLRGVEARGEVGDVTVVIENNNSAGKNRS
jgi:hypothetical protein